MQLTLPSAIVARFAFALAAAVPAAAQNTWVVNPVLGPGVHFTTIQEAANAASPGDTILVAANASVPGFTTNKPLRVQGGTFARITSTIVIQDIAQDAAFELAGFTLAANVAGPGVRVVNCAGVVLIASVSAAGPLPPQPIPGLEVAGSTKVIVRSSTLMGSTFTNSTAVFESCTIHANEVATPHSPAITAASSKVLLTASRAQAFSPGLSIVGLTNGELFISRDSQLLVQFAIPTTVPVVSGTGTVRVSPAATLPVSAPPYGPNISSVIQTLDPLLVDSQTVTVRTGVGDLVAILVGLPGPTHDVPWVNGISWFDPSGPLLTMSLGVATAAATQVTFPHTPGTHPHFPLTWLALTGNATTGLAITNPNGLILH
jgi:hypothetical protein